MFNSVQALLFASWADQQMLVELLRLHHRRLTVSKACQARAVAEEGLRTPRETLAEMLDWTGESNV